MWRRLSLLLLVGLVSCDRALPEEPEIDAARGTFEVRIRQVGGGGFEDLSGTAVFSETDDGIVLRLTSTLPSGSAESTLDLLVRRSTTQLAEADAQTALCVRSAVFADGPYRAESVALTLATRGTADLEGTLDGTAFVDLPTSPTTSVRLRVRIDGSFWARPGDPGVLPDLVRRCP